MIYHYGLSLSKGSIRDLLSLPDHVEVDVEPFLNGEFYFRLRSSEPFDINGTDADAVDKMPWTPLQNAVARHFEKEKI